MMEPIVCPAGYFCEERCIVPAPCDRGYYCPEGFWLPFECYPGTFNDQFHQNTCKSCPAGYYCQNSGTIDPVKCKTDLISSLGATYCKACPLGHVCSTGIDVGLCPSGGYCTNGMYRSCPAGTYNSLTAASSSQSCIQCPPGSYCASQSAKPSECPQGRFNPANGVQSQLGCKKCPAGNYCPKMGLVTPVPCPDGFVCPPGTKSLGDVNIPCPVGNYCRGGLKKTTCPAGSYQVWADFC